MSEIEKLRREALEKNIVFDGRWGVRRLRRAISNAAVVVSDVPASTVCVDAEKAEVMKMRIPKPLTIGVSVPSRAVIRVKNISRHTYEIAAFRIAAGEVAELTEEQSADGLFMRRINRHVELGKFRLI